MDPRIINASFVNKPLNCAICNCMKDNHLIFFKCLFLQEEGAGELAIICEECCRKDFLRVDIDKFLSEKLGREITADFVNEKCRRCGLNNACQNADLAKKIEEGTIGDLNGPTQGPTKTR